MIRVRSSFTSDPKSFYDCFQAKRKSSLFSTEIFYGVVSFTSYFDILNTFSDFFQSTYRLLYLGPLSA